MIQRMCSMMALVGVLAGGAVGVESTIGPAGQVIIDGEPVVPLAVWTQPAYLFGYHQQLGATCMVSPSR